MTSTIDEQEIKKFSDIADEWWSETGKFKPLHKFNPIRILYIREKICEYFLLDKKSSSPFLFKTDKKSFNETGENFFINLKIIDIGCGGGLISEPLSRMGADVTAIDASKRNIEVAKIHAEKSGLKINYQTSSIEDFAAQNQEKFDVVLALEIIEHVANVEEFILGCSRILKDGGILFIATMNRTTKSLLFAKIAAEYILKWLPIGTHSWSKFIKPSEINFYANKNGLKLKELTGFSFNLLKNEWKINKNDLDVNYIAVLSKK